MDSVIVVTARCEIRSVIRFLNAKKLKSIEIHRQLEKVYGKACISVQHVRKWCKEFSEEFSLRIGEVCAWWVQSSVPRGFFKNAPRIPKTSWTPLFRQMKRGVITSLRKQKNSRNNCAIPDRLRQRSLSRCFPREKVNNKFGHVLRDVDETQESHPKSPDRKTDQGCEAAPRQRMLACLSTDHRPTGQIRLKIA
ncbi:hypothetical protein GWI33_016260 [Rhynchophorus ferrugineus]|uniref:Mos1 transposase HTH domain-containing protein n=1 Tax=Rhynchophorus ferrugineus TaxID=354439 RepID=A0A834I1K8_RHYFE|nr:hypothetical protein GWI33_016260 [Rhynchophorus ferrugineus]